jgi:hypothetical protein
MIRELGSRQDTAKRSARVRVSRRWPTVEKSSLLPLALSVMIAACGGGVSGPNQSASGPTTQGSTLDSVPPTVSIASPSNGSSTTSATISVAGSASDDVGVVGVSWRNSSTNASGTASGTANWTASGVALQSGANTIVVTARDAAGNTRNAQIAVTFTPPNQNTAALSWDPNVESDLAGYRIYYGLASGTYLQQKGNGLQISSNAYTVVGLNSSTRYYFAITAVDIAGNESDYSNEVFKDFP